MEIVKCSVCNGEDPGCSNCRGTGSVRLNLKGEPCVHNYHKKQDIPIEEKYVCEYCGDTYTVSVDK